MVTIVSLRPSLTGNTIIKFHSRNKCTNYHLKNMCFFIDRLSMATLNLLSFTHSFFPLFFPSVFFSWYPQFKYPLCKFVSFDHKLPCRSDGVAESQKRKKDTRVLSLPPPLCFVFFCRVFWRNQGSQFASLFFLCVLFPPPFSWSIEGRKEKGSMMTSRHPWPFVIPFIPSLISVSSWKRDKVVVS